MRARTSIPWLVSMWLLAAVPAGAQQNPYRLKDPNQQKLCLACHSDFEATLKKKSVHTAVRSGECASCHDPHVSSHGKLLADEPGRICATCHASIVPANAKSIHKVVADGACAKCHDPHASDTPGNLVAAGADLCFGCHKDVAETVKNAKFHHAPVDQGCLTCHAPHGSDQGPALLKTAVPAICTKCHKPDTPAFVTRHARYPVAKASCTTCHDPHGANQPGLLLTNVHAPVANRMCTQCHENPDSPSPFATKRAGFELCKGCHNDAVTAIMARSRLHWPVVDRKGCISCHNPHASKQPKLLAAPEPALCTSCHADAAGRIASLKVKHAPVESGTCTACHAPHGASGVALVEQPSVNDLCTTCHDYSTHSAHPIGEKAIDPRNKNLRVDCLSCHKPHGTDFKHMLLAETNLELCTQCHTKFGR